MTKSARQLLATAVLSLVGGATLAQAQGVDTVTTVPFEFTAGDTTLPRDQYRISTVDGKPDVFLLRGNRHSIVVMSLVDRESDRNPTPKLTFFRYGDRYFLREVQLGNGSILLLPKTRAEREVEEYITAQAAQKSKVVIASSGSK